MALLPLPRQRATAFADGAARAYIEASRDLFREYARELCVDLCFQGFEEELASLPGAYAPPSGRLLIATEGEAILGCAALRPLRSNVCEMKRLYVRGVARGRGVGRALTEQLVADARAIGYRSMLLDTLPTMHVAIALYERLGFRKRDSYYETPLAGTLFMELQL